MSLLLWMRLVVAGKQAEAGAESDVETVRLTSAQLALLDQVSSALNPDMPPAFGRAHAVRLLLDHVEKAELDLAQASTEAELTRLTATEIKRRRRGRRR